MTKRNRARWYEFVRIAAQNYNSLSEKEKGKHDLAFRLIAGAAKLVGDTVFLAVAMYVLSKFDEHVDFSVDPDDTVH